LITHEETVKRFVDYENLRLQSKDKEVIKAKAAVANLPSIKQPKQSKRPKESNDLI
jgi:hypothetical protein